MQCFKDNGVFCVRQRVTCKSGTVMFIHVFSEAFMVEIQ